MSTPEGLAGIAHDPVAFEAFYRRHVGAVTRFFARRVADPHLVADLTADAFVAVIGSAARYQPELGSELAWLYGIARNVLASQRRRATRELKDLIGRKGASITFTEHGPHRLTNTTGFILSSAPSFVVLATMHAGYD